MENRKFRSKPFVSVLGVFALMSAVPAPAGTILGQARAIDGDTLEIAGNRVRLYGIDAPELDQTCMRDGADWACGREAAKQLAGLVGGITVECQTRGLDQHKRHLAVCFSGGEDLNRTMVEQGWALAYREYGYDYAASELRARDYGLGIWSSQFTNPADFRLTKAAPANHRGRAGAPAPERKAKSAGLGCVIKGNRNRRGEWIYHLPGMPYYEQTRAEEIFCSEDEAWAAGYRRARVRS